MYPVARGDVRVRLFQCSRTPRGWRPNSPGAQHDEMFSRHDRLTRCHLIGLHPCMGILARTGKPRRVFHFWLKEAEGVSSIAAIERALLTLVGAISQIFHTAEFIAKRDAFRKGPRCRGRPCVIGS